MAEEKKKKPPFREVLREGWKPYLELTKLLRPYRTRFLIGLGSGALYGALNGCLPLVVKYVSQHVFGGDVSNDQMLSGSMSGSAPTVAEAGAKGGMSQVVIACILVPAVIMARSIVAYVNGYCMGWVSLKILSDLRHQLFEHVISQSLDFFNKARSGQLISRIMNDTRMAQNALVGVSSDLVKAPLAVIVGVGVLVAMDWRFSLTTLVLFPLCILPMAIYGRKVRKAGKQEEHEAAAMAVILQETFAGVRVIKSFAREDYQADQFDRSSKTQFRNSMKVRKSMEMVGPCIETISAFGVTLALLYVYFTDLPLDKFLGLLTGIFLLYNPVKSLSRMHLTLQKGLSATTNIFKLMEQRSTIKDAPDARVLGRCRGEVEFQNVTFSYGSAHSAVSGVSVHIEAGKKYALVGASGAGKSSMLSLLLRFYDPQEGAIRVDGHDLRAVSQRSLRENVGIVTQETFLFHDTIYENIRYGRLDATKAEILAAAKLAFAHDFIMAQPEGYDTIIGDKGCLLSGGQQQRLAIARALLKNAPILLLDEATSALDSESERMIQTALERLTEGRTVIAIAHRLSTVLQSDQIVVMDQGRIVEVGTHRELIENSTFYRRLYELQFLNPEDEVEIIPAVA